MKKSKEQLEAEARKAVSDAGQLVEAFGDDAEMEAALRADLAIEAGSPSQELRWRNALRMIPTIQARLAGKPN